MRTTTLPRPCRIASKNSRFSLGVFGFFALILVSGLMADEGLSQMSAEPFAERSTGVGETLFTEMLPERTGIYTTNDYDDPRMWGALHSEYNVGAIGTGVAVGDYDNDGWVDVYIVSKLEPARLFRNLGDWRFADVTEQAGLWEEDRSVWKQGTAFVDVNNDGWLDLYLCRFDAPNRLYVNQGDGTFTEEAAERGLDVVDASSMASFADYDKDGWLDVFIQTNLKDATVSIEGQKDYLFHNEGDGYFRDVSESAGILSQPTQGHSAVWWDQNDDGWLDLYVANDFAVPDFLYRNNRDGTFSNAIDDALPHTPFSSMGSDLGDLDNDGDLDFLVADMAGLDWSFSQRGLTDSRSRTKPDYNDQANTAIQIHSNALFLNTRTGRSLEAAQLAGLAGTDWTWAVRFEDLDSDGRIDLFVTNGMDREHNNLDFITRKLSAVNVMSRIRITKASPVLNQANLAFANRGDLRFEEVGAAWGLDKLGVSFGAAFGDFDRDGDLDLVFTNYQEGATVLRNDGRSGNNLLVELRDPEGNRFGVGATVTLQTQSGTQIRQLSLARGYLSTSEPVAHFGLGDSERIQILEVKWPSGAVQRFYDLASGNKLTITAPQSGIQQSQKELLPDPLFVEVSKEMGLEIQQDEEALEGTVRQALLPRRFNRRGPAIAAGDLDGDGRDEILISGTTRSAARVLSPSEGGRFHPQRLPFTQSLPSANGGPPLVFDANGDGLQDVLLPAGGAAFLAEEPEYEPTLWLNAGNGDWSKADGAVLPSVPISVGASVAADFDRDGDLDLFLGGRLYPGFYPEPAYSALLLQEDGVFKDRTHEKASSLAELGLVTSALASDVDGDGWVDLLIAAEWGHVRVFRNDEGSGFTDVSREWGFLAVGSGLWSSLAAADFNGDGKFDYAVGNQGVNTIYQATSDSPIRMFVGDFAAAGEPQLVLCLAQKGAYYPIASRSEMIARIPSVLQRFRSNDEYAEASVEEILGADAVSRSTVYEIQNLHSGVFLSKKDGVGFEFVALPNLAQISPVRGMVAEDFDQDGFCDLLFVQNDYSPIPSQGRWDGGLGGFLKGDGRGGFAATPIAESGWSVPGNAKALVLLDAEGNGVPSVFVTRNGEPSLAFAVRAKSDRHSFGIRLNGGKGNPTAIGARIELRVGGELVELEEIRAGGGYGSQSTSTVFFSIDTQDLDTAKLLVIWPDGTTSEGRVPTEAGVVAIGKD